MKQTFSILFFISFSVSYGQDTLYKKDNSKLLVTVKEISSSTISYKLFNNPNGPLYTILPSEAVLIIFSNGTHQVIETVPIIKQDDITQILIDEYWRRKDSVANYKINRSKQKLQLFTQRKNILFVNLLEFGNVGIGLDYIREFLNQRFLFYATLAANAGWLITEEDQIYGPLAYSTDAKLTKRPFEGGIGICLNIGKSKFVTFNIGPGIKYAQYNGIFDETIQTVIGYDSTYNYEKFQFDKYSHGFVVNELLLQVDFILLLRLAERLNFMAYANVTVFHFSKYIGNNPYDFIPKGYYNKSTNYNQGLPTTYSQFGVSVGYRFNFKNKNAIAKE